MSYTEYLRRKAASSATIINTRQTTDASMYIMKQRLGANSVFLMNKRKGVVSDNHQDMPSTQHSTQSYFKESGGKIADASTYTAFVGGLAINEKGIKANSVNGKLTVSANLPVSLCTPQYVNGPRARLSAGDWVRTQAPCLNGREPHNANEVGPPRFTDDTITHVRRTIGMTTTPIRENGAFLGMNKVDIVPTIRGTSRPCNTTDMIPATRATFTHPEPKLRRAYSARPAKDANAMIVAMPAPPNDNLRKRGAALRKIPYVEKHHGNDGNVNPRRLAKRFQIPRGAPTQLKINDAAGFKSG